MNNTSEAKTLYLIDGYALVFRAHYAFINRPMINSKGMNTSAVGGFIRYIWDLIQSHKPSHFAVCFDPPGGSFRKDIYPLYKAHRQATPEDIITAMPYIRQILDGLHIHQLEVPKYEADDVIGAIAKRAENDGFKVYMVTSDKDYAQLVSDNIKMYRPGKTGNEAEIIGINEVKKIWGVKNPKQIIDLLGLQGDASDNIPGIPGVGPKTALKYIHEFGSVDGIYANIDQIPSKMKEKFEINKEGAILSRDLATICLTVPLEPLNWTDFEVNDDIDYPKLQSIFNELEFKTLASTILKKYIIEKSNERKMSMENLFDPPKNDLSNQDNLTGYLPISNTSSLDVVDNEIKSINIENVVHEYLLIDSEEKINWLIDHLTNASFFCFDTETTGLDPLQAEIVGVSFSTNVHSGYYVPIPSDKTQAIQVLQKFVSVFEGNALKIGQNLKYDINILSQYGIDVQGQFFDTMIAHYLLYPDQKHGLNHLAKVYFNYTMVPIEDLIGKKSHKQGSMRNVEINQLKEYACEDADWTLQLKHQLEKELAAQDLILLFYQVEMPLMKVLCKMEQAGIRLDTDFLVEYSGLLSQQLAQIEKSIFILAGTDFNLNSPKQVGDILFQRLKLPYRWSLTKTKQYSTDEEKLNELAANHEIVQRMLEHRRLSKLLNTYINALPTMVNPRTLRIHTSYNQARAATGRLSSENPNLQNIPVKSDEGREIRKAFVASDSNHCLLSADYSQIELRLIAQMSNETNMLQAFAQNIDIHTATAAGIYQVGIDQVTKEQRRNAKTVNFAIIYGAGATNLSQQLNIPRSEAKALIEQYFLRYPMLKKYMENTIQFARDNGYVETLLHRKRYLRDINSQNSLTRSMAERMAINTPVQGTAADLIKLAMIKVNSLIQSNQLKSKMLLQVHDELIFDVPLDELDTMKTLVIDTMQTAMPQLKVEILVEAGSGDNWLQAH